MMDHEIKPRYETYKDLFKRGHDFLAGNRYLIQPEDESIKQAMLSQRQRELPSGEVVQHDDPDEMERINTLAKGGAEALSIIEASNTTKLPEAVHRDQWELQRVISGHLGWVRSIDVDVTNTFFVTGSVDRLIKVWDIASGDLRVSLTGHIGALRCVKLSDRHPYMFSCGEDNMVKCWDLEANRIIRHYHGHLNGVYSLDIHPSLDILCSAGRDAVVRVWDMRTRQQIHVLEGHTNTIEKVLCQNVEPQILSSGDDRTVRCWDLAAGKCRKVLTHSKKAVRTLCAHPTEYKFLAGGGDGIRVYKGSDAELAYELQSINSIIHTSIIREDNDGALVVAGTDTGLLAFYDLNSGKVVQTIEGKPQPGSLSVENAIFDLTFDRSETRLLTAECDKTIKIYKEVYQE